VVVERVNHLTNLMKAIHKKERRFLACAADQFHDLLETHLQHVFVRRKRGAIKHVNSLCQQPAITIIDAEEARHEEDTSQPNVKLLKVHGLAQSIVGLWDDQINNSLLREAHAEQLELIYVRNLVPLVMDKLAGLIGEVQV
jgi:hypothetical protein